MDVSFKQFWSPCFLSKHVAVAQKTGIPKWLALGKWKPGPTPAVFALRSFNFELHPLIAPTGSSASPLSADGPYEIHLAGPWGWNAEASRASEGAPCEVFIYIYICIVVFFNFKLFGKTISVADTKFLLTFSGPTREVRDVLFLMSGKLFRATESGEQALDFLGRSNIYSMVFTTKPLAPQTPPKAGYSLLQIDMEHHKPWFFD